MGIHNSKNKSSIRRKQYEDYNRSPPDVLIYQRTTEVKTFGTTESTIPYEPSSQNQITIPNTTFTVENPGTQSLSCQIVSPESSPGIAIRNPNQYDVGSCTSETKKDSVSLCLSSNNLVEQNNLSHESQNKPIQVKNVSPNNFTVDIADTNHDNLIKNEIEEKVSKHELFLKKLISNFDIKTYQQSGRGYYCDVCDKFEIYYKRFEHRSFHDRSEQHKTMLQNSCAMKLKPYIVKRHSCRWCNALLYGDVKFWITHINMDYHKLMQTRRQEHQSRVEYKADNRSKRELRTVHSNRSQSATRTTNQNDKFVTLMPSISLYDILSAQETENEVLTKSTVSDSDDSSKNEDIIIYQKRNPIPNYAVLITDLPVRASRIDVFTEFKDFGYINLLEMNFNGPQTAKVVFKYRKCAKNLVESSLPVSIKGHFVNLSLIED